MSEARRGANNPVVDSHTHIFSPDMQWVGNAWIRPDYAFTADDLLAELDRQGIQFAVIAALSIAERYNDYLISQLRLHKRLRGTVIVSPDADGDALKRMKDDGIVGIRLQLARSETLEDFRSDEYRQLFRRVRDLGWHVHVAIEGEKLPFVLDPLLEAGVDVVIDHFGHPDPAAPLECSGFRAMLEAVDKGHTWIKLSGGFRLPGTAAWQDDPDGDLESLAQQVAEELLRRVGTDRLLWGSDAPFVGYEKRATYDGVLASYRNWVPDAGKRAEIDRTALKLYSLEDAYQGVQAA